MDAKARESYLPIALKVLGLVFMFGIFAMMKFFPGSWGWEPHQPEYELMIQGMYFVLGVFLFRASSNPSAHKSLIDFTIWSSVVHGGIMAYLAVMDPRDVANFYGDIPALFAVAIVLLVLRPRK